MDGNTVPDGIRLRPLLVPLALSQCKRPSLTLPPARGTHQFDFLLNNELHVGHQPLSVSPRLAVESPSADMDLLEGVSRR